MLARTNELC
jgi:catalase (peroxidase I)